MSLSDYAAAIYGQPGVEAACLRLQDHHGAGVNLLLFALWQASRGTYLDRLSVRSAIAATADWQSTVVRPLRAVRRRLKAQHYGATSTAAERVRQQVKLAELEGEWAELEILARQTMPREGTGGEGLARRNIGTYLEAVGAELDEPGRAAVDLLVGLVDGSQSVLNDIGEIR